MAINSTIITLQDIDDAKQSIKDLRFLRGEIETAIKAGLTPQTTVDDIDAKIERLKLFIYGYTGERVK